MISKLFFAASLQKHNKQFQIKNERERGKRKRIMAVIPTAKFIKPPHNRAEKRCRAVTDDISHIKTSKDGNDTIFYSDETTAYLHKEKGHYTCIEASKKDEKKVTVTEDNQKPRKGTSWDRVTVFGNALTIKN